MKLKDLLKPKYEVHIVCNEKEKYTKVSGNLPSLLTALSTYVNVLKENGVTENMINYAVKQALLNDEELAKETKKNIDELIKEIFD